MDKFYAFLLSSMNGKLYVLKVLLFQQSQKELYDKYNNTADGRIRIWFGLRQIMNATDQLLTKTRDITQELNTGIHMVISFLLFLFVFLLQMQHPNLD